MKNYTERRTSVGRSTNRGGGDFRGPKEMHNASCADCGKHCEVPFRPNGKKPVFCLNCFGKNGGQVSTNHFSNKPTGDFKPFAPKLPNDSKKFDELSQQLKAVHDTLHKLVGLVEQLSVKK